MLNIVLPIAGRGSRFAAVGYEVPKPLIPVRGVPMIELVVDNLRPQRAHRFIFLALQEHIERWDIAARLEHIAPGCTVIPVNQVTEGAACTVLLARDEINNAMPLMIANTDQYIATDLEAYLSQASAAGCDGMIMTFTADHPKWSYVRKDSRDQVVEVVEKQVISDEATVGIYNFSRGTDFVSAADAMIANNLRVNGEFYVAPTYNQLIGEGACIRSFRIPPEGEGMFGLGTPEDLEAFLRAPAPTKP
ncbi:MAG TPA: glycosyltransferase family 2 protein [Rhodocyclaceae bacterium]